MDLKTKAVDEMMERIKRGIVLRPIKRIQVDKLYSQVLFAFVCLPLNVNILDIYMTRGSCIKSKVINNKLIINIGLLCSQEDDNSWKVSKAHSSFLFLL